MTPECSPWVQSLRNWSIGKLHANFNRLSLEKRMMAKVEGLMAGLSEAHLGRLLGTLNPQVQLRQLNKDSGCTACIEIAVQLANISDSAGGKMVDTPIAMASYVIAVEHPVTLASFGGQSAWLLPCRAALPSIQASAP